LTGNGKYDIEKFKEDIEEYSDDFEDVIIIFGFNGLYSMKVILKSIMKKTLRTLIRKHSKTVKN
jgi:hypothetical protein